MAFPRAAGVLAHPTSLPGPGGIGTIGKEAFEFLETLHRAGVSLWQILPLGPTGYGDSPYSAFSAFAGNPFLVSLEPLLTQGWLTPEDVHTINRLPSARVDFGRLVPLKMHVLRQAFRRFQAGGARHDDLVAFATEHAGWLDDFALYMALKDAHGGAPWIDWEPALRARGNDALERSRQEHREDIEFHRFVQFLFFDQWERLKWRAGELGIRVVGDIPIFVAFDSVDVWAHQELFDLSGTGHPNVVAGVPPDYFSRTGQLWGNPHYRWDVMEETGFSWWIERFRMLLRFVDIVRLDHFRGFVGAWAIPYGNPTAENGQWVPGPAERLFDALAAALGPLPIIAENLGVITPEIEALRHRYGFPGMQILQFAFGSDPANGALPHNFERNTVVYTGTHDNDTTLGWWVSVDAEEKQAVRDYVGHEVSDPSWTLMRLALASVADLAIVPLQDVVRAGTEARMNLPGRPDGNWAWRLGPGMLIEDMVTDLARMLSTYGRASVPTSRS